MALGLKGMQGNEIADDYIRKYAPKGRWRDSWEVFKTNFWKFVVLNIFVLITFVPGIVIIYFRGAYIAGLGYMYPFNATINIPHYVDLRGLAERLTLSADLLFYSLLIAAGFIASVGISGAAYSIRKLIQTHGEFSVKSFFHGVRVGYFNTLLPVEIFLAMLFSVKLVGDWKDYTFAMGGNTAGAVTAYVFIIIAIVLVGIYAAWTFAVGVSYRVKFRYLFKNSLVLLIGTPIQTIFMAGFSLIPVWLYLMGGFFTIISYIVFVFIGFSFILLSWLSFTQWAFDMFITPNLKAQQEAAKAKKSEKELAAEKAEEEKAQARELLAAGKSELIARPIMPVSEAAPLTAIGLTFTRSEILNAAKEREELGKDISAYENEHKDDPVYAEYNKMFAEREKALSAEEGKKGKKKKISSDNLLK